MFGDGSLTFREFMMREPHLLATIHDAILFDFLPGRNDVVLCGAHAVNAYVDEARMTQDVDILSPHAAELADEVQTFLRQQFDIVVGLQSLCKSGGYRISQVREPKHRHLVDVHPVKVLPAYQDVEEVRVLTPPELISSKVICMVRRFKTPKSFIDLADVQRLLLTFPELKTIEGPVAECLRAAGAEKAVFDAWKDLVTQEILPDDEDEKF